MMNRDHGVPKSPKSPRIQRQTTPRKPRVTATAKLDFSKEQLLLVRSNTLLPPTNNNTPRITRSNTFNGMLDKDRARSDDGFHSDSDKDSNHSNISVYSSISHLNKSPTFTKLEPVARTRPASSLGLPSEASKVENLDTTTSPVEQQAGEARTKRKILDLEISIKSLTNINSELDATNRKQVAEIQELKRRLRISDSYISEVCNIEDDDEEGTEVSTPLSEVDFMEIERDCDIRYRRILLVIDEMIRDGKAAIEYVPKLSGSRVLRNFEIDFNKKQKLQQNEAKGTTAEDKKSPTNSKFENEMTNNCEETDELATTNQLKDNTISGKENAKATTITTPKEKDSTSTIEKETPPSLITHCGSDGIKRVRNIIEELLVFANEGNVNSITPTPPITERRGLGILLSTQEDHAPFIPTNHTKHSVNGDPPLVSPTVSLLHELQELLGFSTLESSSYSKNSKKLLPVMTPGRITGKEGELVASFRNHRPTTPKDRIIRRQSSPNFRTPTQSPEESISKMSVKDNDKASTISAPTMKKHSSWVSTLGFLAPWKVAE